MYVRVGVTMFMDIDGVDLSISYVYIMHIPCIHCVCSIDILQEHNEGKITSSVIFMYAPQLDRRTTFALSTSMNIKSLRIYRTGLSRENSIANCKSFVSV